MKALLLVFAALLRSSPAGAEVVAGVPNPDPSAWPDAPVAMLVEANRWGTGTGADLPTVEVFADGTVLRLDPGNDFGVSYRVSRLEGAEWARLQQAIRPSPAFLQLDASYDVTHWTDQPSTEITLFEQGRAHRVSVYGYRVQAAGAGASRKRVAEKRAEAVPAEFRRVATLLMALSPKNEVAWQPRYIEVMLWPFEHASQPPVRAPANWPVADSRRAMLHGERWSLIMPGSEGLPLRDFAVRTGPDRPVTWNGKPWSFAFRLVMPASTIATRMKSVKSGERKERGP